MQFVSGSCDSSTKLWDIRIGKTVMTFKSHETDVNTVTFFPDGKLINIKSVDNVVLLSDTL